MPILNMSDDRLLHALAAFRTPRRICQGTRITTVPKIAQPMWQGRAAHHERECCEDGQHYGSDAKVIGPRRPVAARAVGNAAPSPAGRARVAQPSLVSLRALSLEVSVGAEQIHVVELGESEDPVWRDVEKQLGGLAFLADVCAGCRCRRTLQTAVAGRLRVALVDLKARFRRDTAGLRLSPAPVRKSLLQPLRRTNIFFLKARAVGGVCAPARRNVPRVVSGPAPLRLPMPWPGDDDVLSRAEAAPRWAWRALLAAAAEDVRAILAGEALTCNRSCTHPRGSAAGVLTSTNRVECRAIPAPRSPPPTRFYSRNPSRSSSHPFL